MYACIEVALHGDANRIGRSNWAKGGTHWACGSNIPTPRYHRCCVTHAGSYLSTVVCFLSQLYSKGDLFSHVGGVESHTPGPYNRRSLLIRPESVTILPGLSTGMFLSLEWGGKLFSLLLLPTLLICFDKLINLSFLESKLQTSFSTCELQKWSFYTKNLLIDLQHCVSLQG